MDAGFSVDVRYYRFSEALQPYFTALYLFDIACEDDRPVRDCLHPEWTAMRFTVGSPPRASIGAGPREQLWPFVVSGPTSKAVRFELTTSRIWGLGLQPAGWARFVDKAASDYADRALDGLAAPAFANFAPLLALVQSAGSDADATAAAINAYLMRHAGRAASHEKLIFACHDALRDPEIATVVELGERVGLGARSLERLCARYFGFPPKLLLRRQRFLRSLAGYTLSPRRSWSEVLDQQYYDQAQFVRDFRSFMGMTPSEYVEARHPILDRIIGQRMADQGAAPQTDLPTVLRYGETDAGDAGVGDEANGESGGGPRE